MLLSSIEQSGIGRTRRANGFWTRARELNGTRARRTRMRRRALLAGVGLAIAAACSQAANSKDPTTPASPTVQDHPAAVSLHSVDANSPWNVEVLVVNTAHSRRTIHVDLNGDGAVDAAFPAIQQGPPQDSPWPPYRFNVPGKQLRIHATSSGGGDASHVTARSRQGRLWVLVTDYDPIRLGVQVNTYTHRPGFG